ncbi:MAG TPA: MerR family transcriptional regulator [Parasulfuritortus sp.]
MQPETITAFARRFGLARATLLYYDRIGLLKPAGLSPSGYRLYGEREAARMTRIDTYRKAGLPLEAIRAILDESGGDNPATALEKRLAAINDEIGQLRAQQRLVVELLRRSGKGAAGHGVDVEQWVAMLAEAGVDEAGRRRWHQAFERDAPEAHREFLASLGLGDAEIEDIRRRSRGG